jgi:hypothetical protein
MIPSGILYCFRIHDHDRNRLAIVRAYGTEPYV